jgi:hypothetical protein
VVLGGVRLEGDWRDKNERLQRYIAKTAAISRRSSANRQGGLWGQNWFDPCRAHQPSLASQATARQASLDSIAAKQAKAAAPKPFAEGGLHPIKPLVRRPEINSTKFLGFSAARLPRQGVE